MKISVVGSGYVGLVSGTCFAENGNEVTCIDIDEKKVAQMKAGDIPIYEPGLEVLFKRNIEQNRLQFTTDLKAGIKDAKIIFLALPTPPGEDGSADLSYVLNVADELSKIITEYTVIVDKSTVPVGTADKVEKILSKNLDTALFDVVSNPEFLREGAAIDDFMKPERVVIGTSSDRAKEIMEKLYKPFVRQGNPIIVMDERSAELTKYAANAFLATKISFMNEVANLCEKVGANIDHVRRGIGSDSRIGKRFLFAGIGYGGSCFPKDVQALSKTSQDYDYDFKILNSVMDVNAKQKYKLAEQIMEKIGKDGTGKTIGIWGLAFKPNTDDIREAPSLYIIEELLKANYKIKAFDPEAMDNIKEIFGDKVQFCKDSYQATDDVDALAILTEWNVFRNPDLSIVKKLMKGSIVFDGRNVLSPTEMKDLGFEYSSIGRPTLNGQLK